MMFIIQLVGGILVFVYRKDLDGMMTKFKEHPIALYHDEGPNGDAVRVIWDTIQQKV